jgi:Glutathione S-transferase, N-terminal domain
MALKLIIGNKNYSSWSLRPWIAMKVAGIAFEETVIPLYEPGSREQVLKYSPAGKVPVLIDGDQPIWESLAILEHLAERFPESHLWPADTRARSHARVVANEMHGGFMPLRRNCPMNMWLPPKQRPQSDEVMADVRRIDALWSDCRALRTEGGVPVRRFRRRRCHVCAGGGAPAQLRPWRERGRAQLYGGGNGAAGVGPVARGRAQGALGDAAQRAGLAAGARGVI